MPQGFVSLRYTLSIPGRVRRRSSSGHSVFSAGVFESCSGLVDLVVGVGRHSGGGHRFTLVGERFVGRLAEDFALDGERPDE